jgi:DNA polymerase-4
VNAQSTISPLPQRLVAHFDLDSFFVSVEMLLDPSLRGKPVYVGGFDRGVVAACSYEARKFGIHSGMPSKQARLLCPHAIALKGNREAYSHYSRWVTRIMADKAPVFEKASIDEFYLDLSGMDRFFQPLEWTVALRQQIMDETSLPISFGLATNKMVAKMATNEAKPNGYLFVPPGREQEFLAALPVGKIPGVGEHAELVLKGLKILRIEDILRADPAILEERLGKWGVELIDRAKGIHHSPVAPYHEAKSVSSERTFSENISDRAVLLAELVRLTEKIAYELRQEGKVAGCVAIKIRYPDFETTSKQTTISFSQADEDFIPVVRQLFDQLYRAGEPVRLLGVRLSELTHRAQQTSLFSDAERKQKLYQAIDAVKDKFGKLKIRRASSGK